ncbi:signal peptidase I [Mucilaginibacter psychrotolerans]|uniref:Signal peptidase I n=1 Tax=Mucilaginibacter psychrotolerans TaxID=1524096 RepID=A0A4Y8SCR0_9SPHI|nr:signal peptidase I [Mucilaginibacter psychrotolerans]TFF36136.1 signal peptidase I [Mucilaginibacter psychrotolerans]
MKKAGAWIGHHKKQLIIIGVTCSLFILVGVPWMAVIFIIAALVFFFIVSCSFIKKRHYLSFPMLLLFVIFLAVTTRVFIFEIYRIPSGSMENTLFPGDNVIVSKLNYGPKMPKTPLEIPWLNIFFYYNKGILAHSDSLWWPYRRLNGYSKVNAGDIVVFKKDIRDTDFLIKRCVAAAGDTLRVLNGRVLVNGKALPAIATTKLLYRVYFNDLDEFKRLADSLNIDYDFSENPHKSVSATISASKEDVGRLNGNNCIDSIWALINNQAAYPFHTSIPWTLDNIGPLIVPKKGMIIPINSTTVILYGNLIAKTENGSVLNKGGAFYLNGKPLVEYVFKESYYFMMGDNRNNSNDSRFWGFVKEENIEGRVAFSFSTNFRQLHIL